MRILKCSLMIEMDGNEQRMNLKLEIQIYALNTYYNNRKQEKLESTYDRKKKKKEKICKVKIHITASERRKLTFMRGLFIEI